MANAAQTPGATLNLRVPGVASYWFVTLETGRAYAVTTYPDSDLVSVESFPRRRRLTPSQSAALAPRIRAAIARAEGRS